MGTDDDSWILGGTDQGRADKWDNRRTYFRVTIVGWSILLPMVH